MSLGLGGAVTAGLAWQYYMKMPPVVPLWYSRPWGETQLAAPIYLAVLPVLAIGGGVAIQWLALRLREPVLATLLIASAIVGELIFILGLLRIVLGIA